LPVGRPQQQVGLAAEKGRGLDHIDDFATGAHCSGAWMSVSTGRPLVSRISARIGSPRQADAALAADRGAVRLVE